MPEPITPYERFTLHETLAKHSPQFAELVATLAPLPPPATRLRGLFECAARNNKLRREREERRKFDRDLGIN